MTKTTKSHTTISMTSHASNSMTSNTSNSMTDHSMTNTSNMASSVDGGLCMSMGTDLTRNLLLNWMADLSGDWMTHFSGNIPGNWNLDGVTGNILDRPCGGDTSGLNAGHTDLFWYMTDNSVADLARNRDTDLMRNGTRSLNWDLLALPFSVGLASWT